MILQERINKLNESLGREEFQVSLQEKFKNNETKLGLVLTSPNYNCTPIIYLDESFWERDDKDILEKLRNVFNENCKNIEISQFLNKDYLLENVLPRAFSATNIPELEKNQYIYTTDMDLAFTFYLPLSIENDCNDRVSSTAITSDMLKRLNVEESVMIDSAISNIKSEVVVTSMLDVLKGLGMCIGDNEPEFPMVVISNRTNVNGAGVLISADNFLDVVSQIGDSFVIFPSSVHECICVPESGNLEPEVLLNMVKEVNETSVRLEDKLTDSVYLYKNGNLCQLI